MYDSFDMACHDEDTALRLNIKVNSENLLPSQQKYNVGSLRLPADPSWPKIPQRRLADDIGDLIQTPCIVALNGTPRRSRTVVRAPQSQSCKLHYCQKIQEPQNQQPRRRSGCSDPRFKKVTTVKSQTTSTEPGEHEIYIASKEVGKSVENTDVLPWKNVTRAPILQHAAEKPDETRETESIGIQTVQTVVADMNESRIDNSKESDKNISAIDQFRLKSCSPVKSARKQPNCKPETPRMGLSSKNKSPRTNLKNLTSTQRPEAKGVNNAVDENIVDIKPEGTDNECVKQSFHVQVPVISYHNVPVLISTAESELSKAGVTRSIGSANLFNNIEIPKLEIPNEAVPQFPDFGKVSCKPYFDCQQMQNLDYQNVGGQKKLDILNLQHETQFEKERNDYSLKFEWSPEKLMKNIHNEEKCRPQQNPPNIFKDSFTPKHNFHINCDQDKPFQSVNEIQKNLNQSSGKFNASFFKDRDNKNFKPLNCGGLNNSGEHEPKNWSPDSGGRSKCFRQKRKMKSEQHLMINKKRVQSSEPQLLSCGRRKSRAPYLKKTNSYELAPDSETTLMHNVDNINFIESEGADTKVNQHRGDISDVKREHCAKPYERPLSKIANISSPLDIEKQNLSSSKSPARGETDVTTEKPTAIPVKTQQLLNKSYWEYYNKLKLEKMENGESPQEQYFCQVAMGAPQSKKRRAPESIIEQSNNTSQIGDQVELSLPEIRTLEQCSVLSTMINKTLDPALKPSSETIKTKQIYLNANMRSSSDPTAGTQSAILKKLFPVENEDSIISSTIVYEPKRKRDKQFNKTSKLKSIGEHPVVFFGCMVYAMIVFLPMIYDYFSYEEHDEYEDLSYAEIAFDFIIASFKEAFGEFFDMMNKIFFTPDARMQRLSSGKWRRRISKHHLI